MIQKGRTFSRRPWDAGDHGIIKHFDGIHLEDSGSRGFYLAMHTAKGFLKQQNIGCESDDGFWWEGLVIENFIIQGIIGGDAIYVTDGIIKACKPDLTIKRGEILNLTNSKAITLDHLALGTLCICNLKTDGIINLQNTTVEKLKIVNCSGLTFACTDSKALAIEYWHSEKIDTSCLGIEPSLYNIGSANQDIHAAVSVNVMIDGILYGADIPTVQLTPRKI